MTTQEVLDNLKKEAEEILSKHDDLLDETKKLLLPILEKVRKGAERQSERR